MFCIHIHCGIFLFFEYLLNEYESNTIPIYIFISNDIHFVFDPEHTVIFKFL